MVAGALGEGGVTKSWQLNRMGSGAAGPWQLLPGGGELPRYLAEGNKPGDVPAQSRYVLKRLNEIMPGFSTSTDTAAQIRAVTQFESSGQGSGYYGRNLARADAIVAGIRKIQTSNATSSSTTNNSHHIDVGGITVHAPMREGTAIADAVHAQMRVHLGSLSYSGQE